MDDRISWDEYALLMAKASSLRSEDPYRKVGACALNHQNMVLAVGYNGLASGKNVEADFWKDREERLKYMIHAEVNCLSLLKRGEVKTLAVTLLPCSSCAVTIAAYGVKSVVYDEEYSRDDLAKEIFKFYGVELRKLALPATILLTTTQRYSTLIKDEYFY